MKASDRQVGGDHYKKIPIQPWDFVAANEEHIGYFEGTAIKYLSRWKSKNGIEDLRKAIHFIEKKIEIEEEKLKNGRCRRKISGVSGKSRRTKRSGKVAT